MAWIIQSEPHKAGVNCNKGILIVRQGFDFKPHPDNCKLVSENLRVQGRTFGSFQETVRDLMLAGF